MLPETTVESFSRLHVALLDMGHVTDRVCGGVGFAINAHPTVWTIKASREAILSGLERLDESARGQISILIGRLVAEYCLPSVEVTLHRHAPQHCGFGSKTSLLLSLIETFNQHFGLGLSASDVQVLSGRGGTSGVGIHTFYEGGIIWDGGHRASDYTEYTSSACRRPAELPPLLGRWEFNRGLNVVLFNLAAPPINGTREADFFKSSCPVPKVEIADTFFAVFHGLIPGIVLSDFYLIQKSLLQIQRTGFKARELRAQAVTILDLYDELSQIPGLATGLSSLGPTLYAIVRRDDQATRATLASALANKKVPSHIYVEARNKGYSVNGG